MPFRILKRLLVNYESNKKNDLEPYVYNHLLRMAELYNLPGFLLFLNNVFFLYKIAIQYISNVTYFDQFDFREAFDTQSFNLTISIHMIR